MDVNEEEKSAKVTVPDFQLSLAIGKEGQNARLAAKLTGWKIDIKSESQLRADIEQKLFNINSESAGDEYSERDGGEEVLEENLKGGAGEEVPEEGLEGDIGEEIPKEDVEAGDEISEEGTSERDLDENIV